MSDQFPRILDEWKGRTTIATGWVYPSDGSTGDWKPLALAVIEVPSRFAEHELARLRALDEPPEPKFSKAALDRLEYVKPPPLPRRRA